MKNLITIILSILSILVQGQTIQSDKYSDSFIVDTTRIAGDSIFISVRHFKNEKLIAKTDRVKVILYANSTDSVLDTSGVGASVINTFSHGKSTEWYPSGQLKSQGTFTLGKKNLDWKYWTIAGKETDPPKERP